MGKPDTGWRCAADQICAETGKLPVTNLVVGVVDEDTSPERPLDPRTVEVTVTPRWRNAPPPPPPLKVKLSDPRGGVVFRYENVTVGWYDVRALRRAGPGGDVIREAVRRVQVVKIRRPVKPSDEHQAVRMTLEAPKPKEPPPEPRSEPKPSKGNTPTLRVRIVIIKGSVWDRDRAEMRKEILRQLKEAESIWGIGIEHGEHEVVDRPDVLRVPMADQDDPVHGYSEEATRFMDLLGNAGHVANLVFTNTISTRTRGHTVAKAFAKEGDVVKGEGVYIAAIAEGGRTVAHELGHLLAGETDPKHSKDENSVMFSPGGPEATEPWKSKVLESEYLR
jgi:hypothetical protein